MAATQKYRINTMAKDMGIKSKDILDILSDIGLEGRTHMAVLEPDEFSYVMNVLTQRNQVKDINDYLDGKTYATPPQPKKPAPAEKPKTAAPAAQEKKAEPKNDAKKFNVQPPMSREEKQKQRLQQFANAKPLDNAQKAQKPQKPQKPQNNRPAPVQNQRPAPATGTASTVITAETDRNKGKTRIVDTLSLIHI